MRTGLLASAFGLLFISCEAATPADRAGVADPLEGVHEGPPPIDLVVPDEVQVATFGLG